jgi:hypothetical protein
MDIMTCAGGGTHREVTGSILDDWILLSLRLQPLLMTLSHNTNGSPHILQYLLAHGLNLHS